jgi:biotin transport system substrate-specific component
MCGLFLGKKYGPLSQVFYLIFGVVGIPWFVVGPIGPTGGYIVGFIVAPFIIGELLERATLGHRGKPEGSISYTKTTAIPYTKALAIMLTGVALIYVLGLIQFSIYTQTGLIRSLRYAVFPFIPFDAVKAILAAAVARAFIR